MRTEYFFHTKENPRITVGGIFNPDTNSFTFSVARCKSTDQFEKKIGRAITIGRIKAGKISDYLQLDNTLTPGQSFLQHALELTNLTKSLVEA